MYLSSKKEGKHPLTVDNSLPLSAGVKSDIEELLKKFQKTESIRFETFTSIWRGTKFSLLCSGRQTEVECSQFLTEVFRIILSMMLPPYPFQVRVGALYTLYSVYHTQPIYPKSKIRVTSEEWHHLQSLEAEVRENKHLDTLYVWHDLVRRRAFHHVAFPIELMADKHVGLSGEGDEADAVGDPADGTLRDVFDSESVETLSALHAEYQRAKSQGGDTGFTAPSVLHNDLVQNITKSMTEYDDWRKNGCKTNQGRWKKKRTKSEGFTKSESEPDTDGDNKGEEKSAIGSRRQELIQKSYSGQGGGRKRGRGSPRKQTPVAYAEESGESDPDNLSDLRTRLMTSDKPTGPAARGKPRGTKAAGGKGRGKASGPAVKSAKSKTPSSRSKKAAKEDSQKDSKAKGKATKSAVAEADCNSDDDNGSPKKGKGRGRSKAKKKGGEGDASTEGVNDSSNASVSKKTKGKKSVQKAVGKTRGVGKGRGKKLQQDENKTPESGKGKRKGKEVGDRGEEEPQTNGKLPARGKGKGSKPSSKKETVASKARSPAPAAKGIGRKRTVSAQYESMVPATCGSPVKRERLVVNDDFEDMPVIHASPQKKSTGKRQRKS